MDPYKVLGVPENASDEEIKKAYRELVKKYHPDRYRDDPMAPVAEKKIREVNAAYDMIRDLRSGKRPSYSASDGSGAAGRSGNTGYSGGYGTGAGSADNASYGTYFNEKYRHVIELINGGYVIQAYSTLLSVPENMRDGGWYFLMGAVNERLGRYSGAYTCYRTAAAMEPNNNVFTAKAAQFEQFTRQYAQRAQERTGTDDYCFSARDCCFPFIFCC